MARKGMPVGKTKAPNPLKAKRRTPMRKQGRVGRIAFGVLVGLAVLAVIFFLWARTQGELSLTENAVGSLLSPIQSAAYSATAWVRDWMEDIGDRERLRGELEDAQLALTTLQYRVSQLEEAERENERLKILLSAQTEYEALDPIYAKVIASDPGEWFDTFTINRGTLDGVTAAMAVITGDGLVGRVYEAGLNYAKVLCIIDSRSAVSALIEDTRERGVVRGQLASAGGDECKMYYLPSVNGVQPGDSVITSGTDGMYPKGLPVGLVTAVSRQSDTSDQYITVKPYADFQRLEEVMVLRTVVEQAGDDSLPALPDPTPRPRATSSLAPTATPDALATQTPSATADTWMRPTATPDPGARQPLVVQEGDLYEDLWAEGY